jgi:hypothetical protein
MYILNNLVQEPSHLSNVFSLQRESPKPLKSNYWGRASFHVIKKVNMNFNGLNFIKDKTTLKSGPN